MVQILDLFRQEKINDPFPEISRDLTHREDTENLVRSIWRKWDTKNDCPLPDGVERAWGRWSNPSDPAKLIWIKTGDEYVDT
ncbi:hypothetical protein M408DRAFT_333804 [Serendipita vermifera MAFF 305830]|uniref:Uncharacterized protein n=1 Tax=Serendipita vermifera MAFF 305830 TaxID=933852 RepID=A0A0C2WTF8_SERVB|nr:hypothetical protein M408DRAFT_333804 [Serendipita vermifera MAFF 305830]